MVDAANEFRPGQPLVFKRAGIRCPIQDDLGPPKLGFGLGQRCLGQGKRDFGAEQALLLQPLLRPALFRVQIEPAGGDLSGAQFFPGRFDGGRLRIDAFDQAVDVRLFGRRRQSFPSEVKPPGQGIGMIGVSLGALRQ